MLFLLHRMASFEAGNARNTESIAQNVNVAPWLNVEGGQSTSRRVRPSPTHTRHIMKKLLVALFATALIAPAMAQEVKPVAPAEPASAAAAKPAKHAKGHTAKHKAAMPAAAEKAVAPAPAASK